MPAGAVIESNNTVAGVYNTLRNAGAPVAGTTEVQTITIGGTPTGGTFTLNFLGLTTAPITWSATNATLIANIAAALNALPNINAGGVVVAAGTLTAGIGTITVTFSGSDMALRGPYTVITVPSNALTGTAPTVAVAQTTPGVRATHRDQPKGALVIDTTNGNLYQNTGTAGAPTWTQIS